MNKTDLIKKVKALEGLTQDERAYLVNLVNTKKKYGLVWEDKPEEVEEQLRENLPVLKEVKEKAIINGEEHPNHILIEGDNLHALTALTFTHEGKIDVIYIDPPYNTGNKDFRYNDTFKDEYIDRENPFRHSTWLSFMSRRLKIAKRLLKDSGVIFISIDDNEQSQLKLLCDEVYFESNYIATPVRRRRGSQANLSKNISTIHEYVLIYVKSGVAELNKLKPSINENDYKNPDNDPRGPYVTMPCTNKGGSKYTIITPTGKEISDEWRFKIETFNQLKDDNRLVYPKGGEGKPRYKLFLSEKTESGVIDNSWWESIATNQEATIELKEILPDNNFNNPKPVGLINHILKLSTQSNKTNLILDFFAGSGTTLHATMALNAEDGGNRQCILVTNNENNICEEVTYERNKRVIQGYTNAKGLAVEGLSHNNLRYYKSEFVSREPSLKNKRQLTQLATELLCIKEDCYTEQKINIKQARLFANNKVTLLILFDDHIIPQAVEFIKTLEAPEIKVYVFSMGSDPYTEDFAEVLDKVTLCALPDAIYKAYQNVLPKKNRVVPIIEEEVETPTNESGEQLFNI
jgi:adenine-specific DNA-methyltransferase